jgi:hypothetical protein
MKVAILDDYQNAALSMADWSRVRERAEITVFTDHLVDADAVVDGSSRSTWFASCASGRRSLVPSSSACQD